MASLCKNLRLARHGASYISHRLGAMRTFSTNSPLLKTKPLLQVKSQSPSNARILGPRAFCSVVPQTEPEVLVKSNHATAGCKLFQIDSFSRLEKFYVDHCEIGKFEAGGYKWSLVIHPNFTSEYYKDSEMLVQLYLDNESALPEDWELDAFFFVFVKNPNTGCYYRYLFDREHFDASQTECRAFIHMPLIKDPDIRCVKDDTCVLGVEFFITKKEDVVTEYVSLKNLIEPPSYDLKFEIQNFPNMKDGGWITHQTWTSEAFSIGGLQWKLKVSPRGWEEGTGRLSIFLEGIVDSKDESDDDKSIKPSYTDASFSVTLRGSRDVVKHTCTGRFSESEGHHRGWNSFIDLVTLYDPDKGFIEDGCLKVELDLIVNE